MKILFHAAVLCCLGCAAPIYAQLQKGGRYIAGTLTLDGSNGSTEASNQGLKSSYNRIAVNPSIQGGMFISGNRMIGIGIGGPVRIDWNKNNVPDGPSNQYRLVQGAYTLSPYLRHYKPLHSKWAVFLTSSADLTYLKTTEKYQHEKRTLDGYSAGLNLVPGFVYWVNKRFALESDIHVLSLGAGYRDFAGDKSFYFNSSVTTGIGSYFSVRAAWYIQKL
jgi:hypothetical protein